MPALCLKELAKQVIDASRDQNHFFLEQRINIAIQGGNAANVLWTILISNQVEAFVDAWKFFFFFFIVF